MLPVRRAGTCRRRGDIGRGRYLPVRREEGRYAGKSGQKTRTRIHRVRSDIQNRLGVRTAYVDIDTRAVHIVPEIDEKTPQHCGAGGSCHRKRRWYKEVNKHD